MNRKAWKQASALALALILTLPLCACAKKAEQQPAEAETTAAVDLRDAAGLPVKTEKERPDKAEEASARKSSSGNRASHAQGDDVSEPSAWTQNGAASLAQLREKISGNPVMFGAAYLGYVGGLFDEGFEQGFPAWLRETNQALLDEYPFLAEIDGEHIIGGAGHLYCIVPVDENATIAVNRIKWSENTQTNEVTEVLYRSETGIPILVFANQDGIACNADTQIFITDTNGSTCGWNPSLDEEGYLVPCIIDGECHSWDFTEYQYRSAGDLSAWLADGWLGPTALGLAGSDDWGMTWCATGTAWDTDRQAMFLLTFYPGDETGGAVDLDWQYDGVEEFEEQWSGFWTMEMEMDMPSQVTISLSRVGGKNYDTTDGPMYISETYSIMINRSGENLLIAEGENGVCLPFMQDSTSSTVLTLAMG